MYFANIHCGDWIGKLLLYLLTYFTVAVPEQEKTK